MSVHGVLVAHDGHSFGPLRTAERLAGRLGVELTVACAFHYAPAALTARAVPDPGNLRREERAEERLEQARALLAADVDVDVVPLPAVDVAEALRDEAVARDACLVVVGPDLRGAVASRVLQGASCPVVVAPSDALLVPDVPRTFGVAYDGSAPSRLALAAAAQLASLGGGVVRILTVADGLTVSRTIDDLARATAAVPTTAGVEVETRLLRGRPGRELRAACEDLDLLACGSRSRGRLLGAVLGSVSTELVDDPVCPVLVVPARARRRSATPLGLTTATWTRRSP
ncbi:universal stress protein [Conexibacter sp. SYSU D00693]|uniref:universal stress protein n=1 Tax=Conexibacter sp. SYSU D00693 TaxID=2812560 RepID=UPI00196A2F88|nr:universal stress protein [Conexibacter sp. SYSU D00693]